MVLVLMINLDSVNFSTMAINDIYLNYLSYRANTGMPLLPVPGKYVSFLYMDTSLELFSYNSFCAAQILTDIFRSCFT